MTKSDSWPFKGICLGVPKQKDVDVFKRLVAEVLPAHGCNALVLLIHYRFEFESHPDVVDKEALTRGQAGELAELCRENGIRIIPKMNLMGHQSAKGGEPKEGLLRAHPELDETPDATGLEYCRSLCPRHPEVKGIVFDLADELLDAFGADALHVGLDEVFEMGLCPRCKGTPNSELFAEWVGALHGHLVGEKKAEMLMWGDRLLDGEATGYGKWEGSANDTAAAIDAVPNDIIICDWHYGEREDYPSVRIFTERGFRTLVCPWRKMEATRALLNVAAEHRTENLLGVLATSWCDSGAVARYLVEGDTEVAEVAKLVGESFKRAMKT